jgi:hypothetical protein
LLSTWYDKILLVFVHALRKSFDSLNFFFLVGMWIKDKSKLIMKNCFIIKNGRHGTLVQGNSIVHSYQCTFKNNKRAGFFVCQGSIASIYGGKLYEENSPIC